jgi:hypothetical protein
MYCKEFICPGPCFFFFCHLVLSILLFLIVFFSFFVMLMSIYVFFVAPLSSELACNWPINCSEALYKINLTKLLISHIANVFRVASICSELSRRPSNSRNSNYSSQLYEQQNIPSCTRRMKGYFSFLK